MTKKVLRVAVPLLVVLGIVAVVISRRLEQRAAAKDLTLFGNVDIRQVDLGFRVAGRIERMGLEEGQWARAGDVIAELDARTYRDEAQAAEAELAQREARLEELVHGPRPQEIARARASLREQKAQLERASLAFERTSFLRSTGANPEAVLDDARAARNVAQAKVASAEEALRLLLEGTRAEVIAAARAELDMARARLAAAQTALSDAKLVAPSDGVVLSRVREPGAIVTPTDVVYVLSLTRPVWVRAYVSEPDLGRIRPGMEVEVRSDSEPRRAQKGRIGFISPVAEFTPKSVETPELRTDLVYRLRIIVDLPAKNLRQGMPVTVHIAPQSLARKE